MSVGKPGTKQIGSAVTRDIEPLSLRAAFKPSTVDAEKRTVEITWTTGARVLRGFYDRFWEELSLDPKHVRMDRLQSGRAPLLNSHDQYSGVEAVLGVIESARLEKTGGTATVRFPKEGIDPEADQIFRKVVDGILCNVSVGYRVYRFEQIEGGEDKVPVMLATDWEPHEISLVGIGADAGAGTRNAASGAAMPCEFVVRGMAREENVMDENQTTKQPPAPASEPANPPAVQPASEATRTASQPAPQPDDATRAIETARHEERERITTIRDVVRTAKLDDKLADELISKNTSVDETRRIVLEKLAKKDEEHPIDGHFRTEGGEDRRDKFVRGASAWLFERAGTVEMFERAAKKEPRRFGKMELDPGEFRGLSLVELARESLEQNGVRTRGMSRMELVGEAFIHRSGGASTSDFAILFENVMHKILLGAYAVQEDTWSRFCKIDTVPDFRPSNRYRTGSFGSLDELGEGGEFKNKSIPDGQKTAISTGTRGNIIALSRQAIINDDMSALSDLATKIGRASRLSVEVDVYALLALNGGLGPTQADGQPFFHGNRKNVNATGSELSVAGIEADRAVMARQKDISANEYLDLRPAILVVPTELGGEAKVINDAQFDPTDNKFQKPNRVRGLFRDVVDTPRLSGTRRYSFADPSVAPAIVVAFLEGQGQAPVLESKDGWRIDGVEWKARLDYRAQMFDPKGAVTNAGK